MCEESEKLMPSILVIEDEADLLDDLTTILQLEDYQVSGASRGHEGVEYAFQHQPDLIISDIKLPDLTGLELIQRLKGDPRTSKTSIIIITAHADPNLQKACLAAGASFFLQKPFDVEKFLEMVRQALKAGE